MRNLYFLLLFFVFNSCSEYDGDRNAVDYDSIQFFFNGQSKEYRTSDDLWVAYSDSLIVSKMNKLKNNSKRTIFGSPKGTDYVIRIIFENSLTHKKLQIRMLKTRGQRPYIEYGNGTVFYGNHRNDSFIEYVSTLLKIDEISKYEGVLDQKEYERILKE